MKDKEQRSTQQPQHSSPFDAIREVNEHGHEYWSARKLSKILTYDDYRNFQKVVSKAIKSCESSGEVASDHFVEVTDMIITGKGARRPLIDYHLSRHACYLIEDLPTPKKSIQQLQREEQKRLRQGSQESLFSLDESPLE